MSYYLDQKASPQPRKHLLLCPESLAAFEEVILVYLSHQQGQELLGSSKKKKVSSVALCACLPSLVRINEWFVLFFVVQSTQLYYVIALSWLS